MAPVFDFSGTRALVTGASRGIGSVIATRLAECGARVYLNYRQNEEAADATRDRITALGGSAELARANLVYPEEIRAVFEKIAESGGLDFLVHAAALGSFKPTADLKPNQWDLTMAVTARALLLATKAALPLMAGRKAAVVSVSSLGSTRVLPSYGAIGVAKAALESLTRYLAVELAPRGVRVNAVSAGLIDGTSVRLHPQFDTLAAHARERAPSGRLGTPDEIANVVLFLCSPVSRGIVGQTIVADGGMSLGF